MELESAIAIVTAVIPFLIVGGLLWGSRRMEQRRSARITRQIMLTDAIHRELGAAAAPEVWQAWLGGWTVSMAVPLDRDVTVAALVRITHRFFSELDRVETPCLRIVLTPGARRASRQAVPVPAPRRVGGRLRSAA